MTRAALNPAVSASVSASAGTGKTWLLTSRIVRLLLNGAKPGGIVALTFTRKAAAEMRVRVNERLRALTTSDDAALDALLRELGEIPTPALRASARRLHRQQLFQPFSLRASTLHAFCQDLLNRFAFEAGVAPGFTLIEQEHSVFHRAWQRVQTQILRRPDAAPAQALRALLALNAGEHYVHTLMMDFLQRRNDWRAYTHGHDDAVAQATQTLREQLGVDESTDFSAPLMTPGFTFYLKKLSGLLQQGGAVGSVKPDAIAAAVDLEGPARFEKLRDALFTDDGKPYVFKPSKKKYTEAQSDTLLRTYNEVLRALESARTQHCALQTLTRNAAAYVLGAATLKAFDDALARDHALGFAEVEWRALQLLTQAGAADWVRYKLDQRIEHLLVDEFQDTSSTQWQLLRPLLEEMTGDSNDRSRTAFIVGDIKQSIFGFRRANPQVFVEAQQWIAKQPEAVAEPQTLSQRSAPAIIRFVNALFQDRNVGGAPFVEHDTVRKTDWGQIEVVPPIARGESPPETKGLRNPLTTPRATQEDARAEEEAQQVAARIQSLLASGVVVSDKAGGHRIAAGDVLVLARSRTHLPAVERALAEAGIAFIGATRGSLLHTSEVRDLRALLSFLDAPHRDLELAQVLRSPLFSLDDRALLHLAGAAGDADWWTVLPTRVAAHPSLQRPYELLTRWRRWAARMPVHDLLDTILKDANAAQRYRAALPKGAGSRVAANLDALTQLALETDRGRYPSLSGFLNELDQLASSAKDAPDEAAPNDTRGRVRVLSVHSAKGLEAAAVFLVNAGFKDQNHTPHWLVDWQASDDRPSAFIATAGNQKELDSLSETLVNQQRDEDARENLNLLYVAVTRARQFLHISGMAPARGEDLISWHAQILKIMTTLTSPPLIAGVANGVQCYSDGAVRTEPAPAITPTASVDARLHRPLENLPAVNSAPSGDATTAFDVEAAAHGTAIHAALKTLSEDPKATVAEGRDAAQAVLNAPTLARFFNGVRAWNEMNLTDAHGDGGVADRIVDDGKVIWVLDYKTSPSPDADELRERYRGQIEAYVRAARAVWPQRTVRGGLILTATRTFVEIS